MPVSKYALICAHMSVCLDVFKSIYVLTQRAGRSYASVDFRYWVVGITRPDSRDRRQEPRPGKLTNK